MENETTQTNASKERTEALGLMRCLVSLVKRHLVLENHGFICLDEPAKTYSDNEATITLL